MHNENDKLMEIIKENREGLDKKKYKFQKNFKKKLLKVNNNKTKN